jgi:hypothetical protein
MDTDCSPGISRIQVTKELKVKLNATHLVFAYLNIALVFQGQAPSNNETTSKSADSCFQFFCLFAEGPSGCLDAIEYNQLMEAKSQLDQLQPVPCNC